MLTVRVIALKLERFIGSSSSPDFGLSTFEALGLPISALFEDLLDTESPRLNEDLAPSVSSAF